MILYCSSFLFQSKFLHFDLVEGQGRYSFSYCDGFESQFINYCRVEAVAFNGLNGGVEDQHFAVRY